MDIRDWIRGPELVALRHINRQNELELVGAHFENAKLQKKVDFKDNQLEIERMDRERIVKELKTLKLSIKFMYNDLKQFSYFKKAWAKHQVRTK